MTGEHVATSDAVLLQGGTANYGRVVRVGDAVYRPRGKHTTAVHALLRHLEKRDFDGVPRVIGTDGDQEVLGYVPGRAATEPLAPWAMSEDALAGVGRLLARYHREVADFDPAGLSWQRPVPEPWRGPIVTHNDTNPANVVFRDRHAAAFIDFDLAAPGTAAWDLAVTACFWVPLREPGDISDGRRGRAPQRLRSLLDAYGADGDLRAQVTEACPAANDWIAEIIRDASLRGHPAFGRVWEAQSAVFTRAGGWLRTHRDTLLATVN